MRKKNYDKSTLHECNFYHFILSFLSIYLISQADGNYGNLPHFTAIYCEIWYVSGKFAEAYEN